MTNRTTGRANHPGRLAEPGSPRMLDLIFVVVTIAVFALLALVARGVEKL